MPKSQSRSGVNFFGHSIYQTETENPNFPEQRLWRAVLAQVLDDAFSNSINSRLQNEKKFARDYLKYMHKDFTQLCEWAGFHPSYVHLTVKKKLGREFVERLNRLSVPVTKAEHAN